MRHREEVGVLLLCEGSIQILVRGLERRLQSACRIATCCGLASLDFSQPGISKVVENSTCHARDVAPDSAEKWICNRYHRRLRQPDLGRRACSSPRFRPERC